MSDGENVSSRWWLLVAAMPFVTVTEATLGFLLVGFVYESVNGIGLTTLLIPASPFIAIAVLIRVLLPLGLYRDAQLVREADLEWKPDPANWGFLGLGLIFVPVLDTILAVTYLTLRSRAFQA